MAQFISVGGKVINLDLVTAMYDGEIDGKQAVTVRFTGDDSYIRFRGECRTQLLKFIAQQTPIEKVIFERHECHICGFAGALRCEGCRKWVCGGHSQHAAVSGEIQRLCDECRGFIRDTTLIDHDPDDPFLSAPDDTYTV